MLGVLAVVVVVISKVEPVFLPLNSLLKSGLNAVGRDDVKSDRHQNKPPCGADETTEQPDGS